MSVNPAPAPPPPARQNTSRWLWSAAGALTVGALVSFLTRDVVRGLEVGTALLAALRPSG